MERGLKSETTVGMLLLAGLGLLCGVVLLVGENPDLFKGTYQVTVEFRDASGVVKGSDVQLSGALIGKVTADPQPIPNTQNVAVHMKLNKSTPIRRDASYTIGSAGVFGDKFIKVCPRYQQLGEKQNPYIQDGDVLQGERSPDITALITAALPLIHTANHSAVQLDDMIGRLNNDVLTQDTVDNLHAILGKLPEVGADSRSLMTTTGELVTNAKSKESVIGGLLYDKDVRADLADFMANYKAHGAVFYSDDAAAPKPDNQPRPSGRARR